MRRFVVKAQVTEQSLARLTVAELRAREPAERSDAHDEHVGASARPPKPHADDAHPQEQDGRHQRDERAPRMKRRRGPGEDEQQKRDGRDDCRDHDQRERDVAEKAATVGGGVLAESAAHEQPERRRREEDPDRDLPVEDPFVHGRGGRCEPEQERIPHATAFLRAFRGGLSVGVAHDEHLSAPRVPRVSALEPRNRTTAHRHIALPFAFSGATRERRSAIFEALRRAAGQNA
jgi:hypothetical protein